MFKVCKRIASMVMALAMAVAVSPLQSFAAVGDTIEITISVYDNNTGYTFSNVGTDIAYKGDPELIQSQPFTVKDLSEYTDNEYGRITHVAGNMYFPTSGRTQVGSQVEWSTNNNKGRLIYYVNGYTTGTGSSDGTGVGSGSSESVGSGSKSWTTTVKYHSNYPDGSDNVVSKTYNVKSYTSMYNIDIPTLTQLGFSEPDGYTQSKPAWNAKPDGSGKQYGTQCTLNQGVGKLDIYAQWAPEGGVEKPDTLDYTVTYWDESEQYAQHLFLENDEATVIDDTLNKDNKEFKGWDESSAATSVVYTAGDVFTVSNNKSLYAVWEETSTDTVVLTYDANGGTGGPSPDDSGVAEGSEATFTISSTEPTRDGYTFLGWADTNSAESAVYTSGNTLKSTTDKTIYAVWETENTSDDTIVLSYDANGGTGAPLQDDSGIVEDNINSATFTVSSIEPTRDGYTFLGWGNTFSDDEVAYKSGDTIITQVDKTIYAIWEEDIDSGDEDKVSVPGMDKKEGGTDSIGTVAPKEELEFTLNSHIGQDLGDYVTLEGDTYTGTYNLLFHDKLTGDAKINISSISVTVGGSSLTSSQFTVDRSPSDGDTFDVLIDAVQLLNEGVFNYEDAGKVAVVVAYTATVNEGAADNSTISNTASVNDSIDDVITGTVDNEKPTPPITGGPGTLAMTLSGLTLMLASAVFFVKDKKKLK